MLVLLLAGCSSVRLGYNNAPLLVWWWLDGYVDFSREHAPRAQQGIERWFEWHRATQLPIYAQLLAAVGPEMLEPATPAQVCRWQARVRDALSPSLERAVEIAAELVPTLGEAQLRHIEQRYAKINDEMRSDFLQPDPAVRLRESIKRTVERAERLDRQRRQRDTLAILRELGSTPADRDQRLAGLRTLALRLERSPDPGYRAYQARLVEYNCGFAAQIHNAATDEQRRRARDTVKGWEADLRALTATPG